MSRFVRSDVWVLLALLYAAKPAPRERIRSGGDYINHAVMTDEELDGGLARLMAAEFVSAGPAGWDVVGQAAGLNAEIERASEATGDHSPRVGLEVVGRFLGVDNP